MTVDPFWKRPTTANPANPSSDDPTEWAARAIEIANTTSPDLEESLNPFFDQTAQAVRIATLAAIAQDVEASIEALNAVLVQLNAHPQVTATSDDKWRVRMAARPGAEQFANAVWGLVQWLCRHGSRGIGACHASHCSNLFLRVGKRQHRRFCSDRCATRTHVRAHRARRSAQSAPYRVDGGRM